MKIIKTAEQAAAERKRAELAKSGCNTCPCCGENMSASDAIMKGYGFSKGISSFSYTVPVKSGLFWGYDLKTVDRYGCNTCGAAWESDPY